MPIRTKPFSETVVVELTAAEAERYKNRVLELLDELDAHALFTKSQMAELKAKKTELLRERDQLRTALEEGKEEIEIDAFERACADPTVDMVEVVRMDTGELLYDRPMTDSERSANRQLSIIPGGKDDDKSSEETDEAPDNVIRGPFAQEAEATETHKDEDGDDWGDGADDSEGDDGLDLADLPAADEDQPEPVVDEGGDGSLDDPAGLPPMSDNEERPDFSDEHAGDIDDPASVPLARDQTPPVPFDEDVGGSLAAATPTPAESPPVIDDGDPFAEAAGDDVGYRRKSRE